MQRWNMHLDPTISKSYWTKDEDEKVGKNAFENLIGMCQTSCLLISLL